MTRDTAHENDIMADIVARASVQAQRFWTLL